MAHGQDLGTIDQRIKEVRTLQQLACPAAGPRAARYAEDLKAAVGELRDQLTKLQQQATSTSFLGDTAQSITKVIDPQIKALGDTGKDACAAATAFVQVQPVNAATVAAGVANENFVVSSGSLVFDDKEVGDQAQIAFSVTNKGSGKIALKSIQLKECKKPDASCDIEARNYEVVGGDHPCPNILSQSEHCDVKVVFKPVIAGQMPGLVTLTFNDGTKDQTATVQLTGKAYVANLAHLNGDGTGSNNPSMRSVAGFDISGASSAPTEQKAFLEFNLNVPVGPVGKDCWMEGTAKKCVTRKDPLSRPFWAFFNPRITSLPQERSALANFNVQGFTDFFTGKTTDLVQGLDVSGGFEYLLIKPRTGIPFFSSYKNAHARVGIALVGGVGFTTPFATPGANPTVFQLAPSSPLRHQFQTIDSTTGNLVDIPASFANIAFIDRERSRFFRKYFAGIRLKTYQFSDLAEGELCDHDFTKKYNRPCEAIYGLFPGVIDLTFGQDEQVTGGKLSRWIFRLDAVYPLPFAPAFNIFGSLNTALQKNVSTNALILPPTSTTPLGDPSVFVVNVDPRSRDLYRIGLGVNLVEIIKRASQSKTPAPQDKPNTTMKDVQPKP